MNIPLSEYLALAEHQAKPLLIPIAAEIPLPRCSPVDFFEQQKREYGCILESMSGSEHLSRYSYVITDPVLIGSFGANPVITGTDPFLSICRDPDGSDAVEQLQAILSRFNFVNVRAPRFFGGFVGYFTYELAEEIIPRLRRHPQSDVPAGYFMLAKDCTVFDQKDQRAFVFSTPLLMEETDPVAAYEASCEAIRTRITEITALGNFPPEPAGGAGDAPHLRIGGQSGQEPVSDEEDTEFCRKIGAIKEHIRAGDIFQAVLSRSIRVPCSSAPLDLYRALRTLNPSPYMYYLDVGDRQVIGASPEMLVRVENRRITTVPIAGTRPRGRTAQEDAQYARELLADEKERAEHTMLVDLARNDVGRVSRYGTVTVENFMSIEKYSHVQHIVSTVKGILRDNLDCFDAFRSCFPAGTVTGAPKIRAMEIIRELEGTHRGVYAGAVGYAGFNRNLEFAIAIRTIVLEQGIAEVRSGAGIVADSVPEREVEETRRKAQAMIAAIRMAGSAS
ncbi:MAG: anthranilate synthase component I family protein [Methanomicrobiales archaeon]|nr:anthranilate synthase component I family protein [Methanomicrobiales archaeon]